MIPSGTEFHITVLPENQEAELQNINLTQEELKLVDGVVNWTDPGSWIKYLIQTHGRSLVFLSPSQPELPYSAVVRGKFRGLQVIGAGGDPAALQSGISARQDIIELFPVTASNYAEPLSFISELREVGPDGILRTSYREYVPLGGMTHTEAANRARFTGIMNDCISQARELDKVPFFNPPQLAASGTFTNRSDPNGNRLAFQVYRVPLEPRLPNQLVIALQEGRFEKLIDTLQLVNSRIGATLAIMHRNLDLAYMDAHIGNMSLLVGDKTSLYVTDLGSIREISDDPQAKRYMAIDIFTATYTQYSVLKNILEFMHVPQQNRERLLDNLYKDIILWLGHAYVIGDKGDFRRIKQSAGELLTRGIKQKNAQAFIDIWVNT